MAASKAAKAPPRARRRSKTRVAATALLSAATIFSLLALWPLDARDLAAAAQAASAATAAAAAAADAADAVPPSPAASPPPSPPPYTRSAVQVPCRRGGWLSKGVCHAWLYEPVHPLPTSYSQLVVAAAEAAHSNATTTTTPSSPPLPPGAGVVMGPPLGAWRRHELHRPADVLARAGLTVLAFDYAANARASAPATHAGLARDWADAATWLLARLEAPLPRDQVKAAQELLLQQEESAATVNATTTTTSQRRPPVAARVALFAWDWSASPAALAAVKAGVAEAAEHEEDEKSSIDRWGAVILANPWPAAKAASGLALLLRRPWTSTATLLLRGLRDAARAAAGVQPLWSPLFGDDRTRNLPPALFDAWAAGVSTSNSTLQPLVRSSFALLALPWWRPLATLTTFPRLEVPLSFVAPHLGDGRPPHRRPARGRQQQPKDDNRALSAGIAEYVSASKRGKYVNFEAFMGLSRAAVLEALAAGPTAAVATDKPDAFDTAMHNQAMFLHAVLGSEYEFGVDEALIEAARGGGEGEEEGVEDNEGQRSEL